MPPYNPGLRKNSKNPYIDQREIRQSLVHKSRLRKNYFKELKNLGESIPEKRERNDIPEQHAKKPLTFQERSKIAKQRKDEQRIAREAEREERWKQIQLKRTQREARKEKLNQKTRSGQPLMGPRIEDLLDKIKKQQSN
ncbi:hypothetical protein WICMUC_005206 [Wickerhamomyces mucosus]|uniref:rRNA-processing protein FYV7 n=1 Tax=Wickerhamomyces mucosus TaxID=1378264 RepID=A0A9P8T7C1_9ASCO|nr:hypothetical protein WICMUC_005206 [Wickerhamomyces mucosus]